MCHGDGLILNRDGEIRHAIHPQTFQGPLVHHNGYLAALDSGYFSLWARYRSALDALRARGASADEERRLQRDAFVWTPGVAWRARHAGRRIKALLRYQWLRRQVRQEFAATANAR